MSWVGGNWGYQNLIDEIVQDYKTVLVAGAGNTPSYQTPIDGFCESSHWDATQNRFISNIVGMQYFYPTSYNGVISVAGINHKNNPTDNIAGVSPFGYPIGINVVDPFSPNVNVANPSNSIGLIFNGFPQNYCTDNYGHTGTVSTNGIVLNNTTNPLVDILAPGYDVPNFLNLVEYGVISYFKNGGTSSVIPFVSGTAALIISVNKCLTPNDIEVILKLTTKDVEVLPINQNFVGITGAGALNAVDAVEFVNEIKKVNGNAVIDNHIFSRFEFNLNKINNNLTFSNVTLTDNCKSDFTTKNQIRLLASTRSKPNLTGVTHLSINPSMIPIVTFQIPHNNL